MSKCLVTKLNGIVENDALMRLGEIAISVDAGNFRIANTLEATTIRANKASLSLTQGGVGATSVVARKSGSDTDFVSIYVTESCIVYIPQYHLKRLYITPTSDIDIKYLGVELGANGSYFSVPTLTSEVSLGSIPTNIRSVSVGMCKFNLDEDEYPSLIALSAAASNRVFVIDAADIAERMPILRDYSIWSTADNSSGSFDDFGKCKSLNSLKMYHGVGTIEGFVANQRATYGSRPARTSGSVELQYLGSVTFNGSQITTSTTKTLSWTATTITFDGTTITA